MARPDKAAAVEELAELFRGANAAVLTEYRGLTVAQLKTLRRSLSGNASKDSTLTSRAHRQSHSSLVTQWRLQRVFVTLPRLTHS
jgi:ribosomal protein L10